MFPLFQNYYNPQVRKQQMVNSVVYHPCPWRLALRLTFTFNYNLTLINSNLIKQKKHCLFFRIKFKQFHIFSAYSKLQCVYIICTFLTAMVLCSRFIWITNSSDDRRVWTANNLHTKYFCVQLLLQIVCHKIFILTSSSDS